MKRIIVYWLPLAVVIIMLAGMVYLVEQQSLRASANNPQIQMAEDAAAAIEGGQDPIDLTPATKVDIATSLAPYMIIYDSAGDVLASSAQLNGETPLPPPGVFAYAQAHGEDRVTWQPQPNVRSALVIVHVSGMQPVFVLAGRSLREIERQETKLGVEVGIICLATLLAALLTVMIIDRATH